MYLWRLVPASRPARSSVGATQVPGVVGRGHTELDGAAAHALTEGVQSGYVKAEKQKKRACNSLQALDIPGRSSRIRTYDLCLPKAALYQAELYSDALG